MDCLLRVGLAAAALDAHRGRHRLDWIVVLLHAPRRRDPDDSRHSKGEGRRGLGGARRGFLSGAQISGRARPPAPRPHLAQVAGLCDLDHRLLAARLDLLSRRRPLSREPVGARAFALRRRGHRDRLARGRLAGLRRSRPLPAGEERGRAGRRRLRLCRADGLVLSAHVLRPRRAHPYRRAHGHDDGRQRVFQHHAQSAQGDRRPGRGTRAQSGRTASRRKRARRTTTT